MATTTRSGPTRLLSAIVGALLLGAAGVAPAAPVAGAPAFTASSAEGEVVRVIVRGTNTFQDAAQAVRDHAGVLIDEVDLIDAVVAELPTGRLAALEQDPRTAWVHRDRVAHLQGQVLRDAKTRSTVLDGAVEAMTDGSADQPGADAGGDAQGGDSLLHDGSLHNIVWSSRLADVWLFGHRGDGIDVALIDSGVTPVQALGPERLLHGPDFSVDADDPGLLHLDAFGHGTHLAGIIAGRDPGVSDMDALAGAGFTGLAPGSRVVSVKVAGADGATDLSRILQALDWVVDHAQTDGQNIRVVELALAVAPAPDHRIDPLSAAVEAAWKSGLVVVVAAGNTGDAGISSPAYNPYVIAVGAIDQNETARTADDVVLEWSAVSRIDRAPDVVAMGERVASLRVPGSLLSNTFPAEPFGPRILPGSGTSQASAVVAATAAVLLDARPDWTPDQVKFALRATARPYVRLDPSRVGEGLADGWVVWAETPTAEESTQHWSPATGGADLRVESAEDITGPGESGSSWDESQNTWLGSDGTVAGSAWGGSAWGGSAWGGSAWGGSAWGGSAWGGSAWGGTAWG